MDCSLLFASIFSGTCFRNQNRFNEALRTFEVETGTQYLKISRQPHREGTVEKTLFDFKHAQFACAKYGAGIRRGSRRQSPTGCTAKFTASSTGGSLRVLKFDMLHNHPPEPVTENFKLALTTDVTCCDDTINAVATGVDDEPVMADLTKEFLQTFENRSFDSFQDLLSHMNAFMKATGSNYVMRNTVRFPKDYPNAGKLVYRSIAFECYHFGTYTSYATIRRKQRTVKIGCRSKIYFCCKGDRLQVGSYQIKHNHEVSPGNGAGELKISVGKNRRKNPVDLDCKPSAKRVLLARDGGCDIAEAPENGNFGHSSSFDDKGNQWVGAPGPELYPSLAEVFDGPPRRANRISAAVLFSQLDLSLENLKSLASSGGTTKLFSCVQDLNALENKWRREFEQEPSCEGVEVPFSVSDVFPNDDVVDAPLRKRPNMFSPSRRIVTRDFSPTDIPQPPDLEQSEAEYANRPWFYD
ncbi:conserved hypothetical protein [Echinococcus multilocularis]|uniref:Transcription factor FAR1 n=1 Tax=Echinococcus multilocularis TaxID=6211 RepID=A0A068Y485_ECHMU|nr:conserved hypothetical protein [Echinococcus multilocularis]